MSMYDTKELMHCHCGANNRTQRWTFMDHCKPEVRPGAREESSSPAWLARTHHQCPRHNESVYMEVYFI